MGLATQASRANSRVLAEPFRIGSVTVPNRVVLAPMAGLTCSAYRRHMKAHGVGLVVTEMVSAQGLLHRNARTGEYLAFVDSERPIAVQLFGDAPEAMARAAAIVLSDGHPPDILDINMGCPVRKVVKTGAGAALLGDPVRAVAVAKAVVDEAASRGVPVTVKLRGGMRPGDRLAVDLAPRLEQVGVAALAMHPRAASEYYRGKADHSVTREVKRVVGIPVMASGDMDSLGSALGVMEDCGVEAVMVARGGAGDPWLVDDLLAGVERPRPALPMVVEDLRRLLEAVAQDTGQERAARWIRKVLTWYLRPSGVAAASIVPLRTLLTAREVDAALAALAAQAC